MLSRASVASYLSQAGRGPANFAQNGITPYTYI